MAVDMPRKNVPPPLELVKSRIRETTPPNARERIESGTVTLIDARDPESFAEGHIPGAINIPAGQDASNAGEASYAEQVAEAAGGRDAPIALYCGSGNRAARATDALANQHGFDNVTSIVGGLSLWRDLGYPVKEEE